MTEPLSTLPALRTTQPRRQKPRRLSVLTLLFAAALLISFLLQLSTARVADWTQFAIYDPGTTLKGDLLLAKHYVPTVDFGYTHGLLSLLYGRIGFALLGRTPVAFLLLTLLTEAAMAWALARIFVAAGLARKAVVLFLAALPTAIMPAYLTLTHPLEAMLLLLALAAQSEGRRSQALALATLCLFVKPSMAYVYGFLLLVIILWNTLRHARVPLSERLFSIARQLAPAAVVGILTFAALALWMGITPVIRTLLPITGATTYAATGFGFFRASGRAFWMLQNPLGYLVTTAGIYLLAVVANSVGAIWAAAMLILRRGGPASTIVSRQRAYELLMTTGALNGAFLLAFYGWTGSWSYYSYLPMLGLTTLVILLPIHRITRLSLIVALIALFLLSYVQLYSSIFDSWHNKTRSADAGNLWVYPAQFEEWQSTLDATHNAPTLVLTNGFPPNLPPNVSLPDAWFPEPGIPTAKELARIRRQVKGTQYILLWWEYRRFDLWNSPTLRPYHSQFHEVLKGQWFTLLERNPPTTATRASTH